MARTFAAGTDNLVSVLAGSGPQTSWSAGGWYFITTETNAARLFHGDQAGTAAVFIRLSGVAGLLEAQAIATTINADSITSTAISLNTWTFIAATFTTGTAPKIYIGTLAAAATEAAYTSQVADSGTLQTWTHTHFGNNHAGTAGLTGRIARPFIHMTALSLPRLVAIQFGAYGWLYDTPSGGSSDPLIGFWDLSNADKTRNPLLNNTTNAGTLTSTGLTAVEEPPVPLHLAG